MNYNFLIKKIQETFEKTYVSIKETYLVEFLKKHGFRPKNNKNYIKNLLQRLEKCNIEMGYQDLPNEFVGRYFFIKHDTKEEIEINACDIKKSKQKGALK